MAPDIAIRASHLSSCDPMDRPIDRPHDHHTLSLIFNGLFYLVLVVLMIIGLPTMLFGRHGVFALARLWGAVSAGSWK